MSYDNHNKLNIELGNLKQKAINIESNLVEIQKREQ